MCAYRTYLQRITTVGSHVVQNISISYSLPGQLRVTGDFIEGSTATGVLVALVNGTANVQHHRISRDHSVNGIDGVISGLPGGQYTVSIFVVDEGGNPFRRAAAKPRRISVKNG